jgi:VanZ like family
MFEKLAKVAAWASILFIIFATLVPIGMRPSVGEINPNYERFAAYAVAAALMVLAYPGHPVRVGVIMVAIAVVLEVFQLAIPHRDARVADVLVKVAGALVGIAPASFCNRLTIKQNLRH